MNVNTNPILLAYVQDVKRRPLVSVDDEFELGVRAMEGDEDAIKALVNANLRLVVKIAYEYKREAHKLLDLIQEGNIGLMRAARKFDPYREIKFSTYAAWWIKAKIKAFIMADQRLVKLGTNGKQRKMFSQIRKVQREIESRGFVASAELVARQLGVTAHEVEDILGRLSIPEVSMHEHRDAVAGGEAVDMEFEDNSNRPDANVENDQFSKMYQTALDCFGQNLTGRESVIFFERIISDDPCTLEEIAAHYGLTRERIRQIEAKVTERLRRYLVAKCGEDFVSNMRSMVKMVG